VQPLAACAASSEASVDRKALSSHDSGAQAETGMM
jgi:hypothetical protein